MAHAKKTLKAIPRNPEGTPADQLRCPYYHPRYCAVLGHKVCSSPSCGMKTKSKHERAAALKVILVKSVDREVKMDALLGMYFFELVRTDLYVIWLILLIKFYDFEINR